jgi:hypothetical protein
VPVLAGLHGWELRVKNLANSTGGDETEFALRRELET